MVIEEPVRLTTQKLTQQSSNVKRNFTCKKSNVVLVIIVHVLSKFCQTLFFSFTVATSQDKRHNLLFVLLMNKTL